MAAIPKRDAGQYVEGTRYASLSRILNYRTTVDVVKGQVVAVTDGGVVLSANGGSARGIALDDKKAGQGVDVLLYGGLGGYDLSGMSVGDAVYDSASSELDTAGTNQVGFVDWSGADESGKVIWINTE